MKTCLIVDGLNLFTRHYIANPSTNKNGESVGGITGTLVAISSLAERFSPDRVIVVWESGGSARKRAIFKNYKSGRKPQKLNRYYGEDIPNTIENRNSQISVLISLISSLPIVQVYVPDCEADDVIGYLCKYRLSDQRKVIVSSDKDFYQLLDKKTIIYSPTWKKFVSFQEVQEKFKISSQNFCLGKAICGDSSDNIPGVKGAGFKTIAKRFPKLEENNFFTISELINHCKREIESGSKVKVYKSILESEDVIRRNWKLINLDTNNLSHSQICKINSSVDTFGPTPNKMKILKILKNHSIQNIDIDRVFLSTKFLK